MEIKTARAKEDYIACWTAVQHLRPHLDLERYLVLVLYMQDEGYRLIYIEEEGKVVAFCGYRPETMLHRGRSLYIDDLCTLPQARKKGYASRLLKQVFSVAEKEEYDSVHLDSGSHRHEAHRLYLNQGFDITSFHFARPVDKDLRSALADEGELPA
jgi:ribosomal protein S18 acetylase RimI-like enzyme